MRLINALEMKVSSMLLKVSKGVGKCVVAKGPSDTRPNGKN